MKRINSFLEPFVLLERLPIEKCLNSSDNLIVLIKKGNEGVSYSQPHTCSLCSKVYTTRFGLKRHLEIEHLKATKLFCDLCPSFYFTKARMRHHMNNIHSKKNFCCNICEYKTSSRSRYKNHKQIHSKTECPICQKPVGSVKSHLKTHAPKKCCPVCNKLVTKVKEHMTIHFKKCRICDEIFENQFKLKR